MRDIDKDVQFREKRFRVLNGPDQSTNPIDNGPKPFYRSRLLQQACLAAAIIVLLLSCILMVLSYHLSYEGLRQELIQLYGDDRARRYFTQAVFLGFESRLRIAAATLGGVAIAAILFHRQLARRLYSFMRILTLSFVHERRSAYRGDALTWTTLFFIAIVGFALRVRFINQPMRGDESATVLGYASKPLYIGLLIYNQPNNHLFHTLLVHIAMKLAGSAEWAVRLPAFIAGGVMCLLVYALARRLVSHSAGLWAAALVSTSSILVEYSTNARGYTLICCSTLALLVAGFETLRRASPWWFCLFGMAALVGFWTIPIFIFPFGGTILWLTWESRGKHRRFRRIFRTRLFVTCLIAGAATIFVYLPPFIVNQSNWLSAGQVGPPLAMKIFLQRNYAQLRFTRELWSRDLPVWSAWLLLAAFFLSLLLYRNVRRLVLCSSVWVLCLVVLMRAVLYPRFSLFFLPICLMSAAAALLWLFERVRPSFNRAGVAAATAAILAVLLAAPVLEKRSILDSTETGVLKSASQIAGYIGTEKIPPDQVFAESSSYLVLQYYLWRKDGSRPENANRQALERRNIYEAWFLLNFVDGESLEMFAAKRGFQTFHVLDRRTFDGACLYHVTWSPAT